MSAQTKQLHGLRAAKRLVNLVWEISQSGALTIGGCEIDLENGEKRELCLCEYVDLAEQALDKALAGIKKPLKLQHPGLN